MISIIEKRTVPSENSSINLCDPSFSSFLNDTDDTFLRKLVHSSPSLNSIVPSPSHNAYIPKKKVLDGEIGIFGAEKYFTGAIDEERSVISTRGNSPKSSHHHQQDREERVFDIECPVKHNNTRTGTPSVRSEASWNSRSALLQSSSRNQPQKEANKVSNVKSFLASLGCNCNGNDSVKVRKTTGEDRGVHGKLEITKPIKNGDLVVQTTKSLSSRWAEEENQSKKLDRSSSKREDCFSFPVVNSKAGDQTVKTDQLREEKEIVRNSLEVFGSPIMEKAKKSFSLERKSTTLNWDGVTRRVQDIKIPPPNQNDDTASDASSDLFEIESFSTNGNSFLGRQASEAGGMSNPSNCYAPSEASIDWSVATASAADFAVISEYNELRKGGIAKSSSTIAWNMKSRDKQGNEHEVVVVQKRAPGILSGCASLKSVRVAGDEYRTTTTTTTTDQKVAAIGSPRAMHHRLDSATPIAKFQAEAKLTGFDSRSRGQNNGFVTHTLPRSHSPHLLYIQ